MMLHYARYGTESDMGVDSIEEAVELGRGMVETNSARPMEIRAPDGTVILPEQALWESMYPGGPWIVGLRPTAREPEPVPEPNPAGVQEVRRLLRMPDILPGVPMYSAEAERRRMGLPESPVPLLREPGFYWVRRDSGWEVARFDDLLRRWHITGNSGWISDETQFAEIGARIPAPS